MKPTLYDPSFEHDACGVGFVAHIKGEPSHQILQMGLNILRCLVHRGAFGNDPETGDGAGLLVQIPDEFLQLERADLPKQGDYGVGMAFLPNSRFERHKCRTAIESVVRREGQDFLGWRTVPVDPSKLGRYAAETVPTIAQFFVGRSNRTKSEDFERKLFLIRKVIEQEVHGATGIPETHIFSISRLSSQTVVYKGLMLPDQVDEFYLDLKDPKFKTAIALVHQRFSTSTLPSWPLAHPYRYLAHNGEINTIRGNRSWMNARQMGLTSPVYGSDLKKLFPLVSPTGSDSASLDNAVELLTHSGMSLPQALMVLIPEAWERAAEMPKELNDFYAYYNCSMEPWDGPASICFSDGRLVGGILDRNGLRPARYAVTKDDLVIYASETGVIEIEPERIVKLGRTKPGEIFLVDTKQGRIVSSDEIKKEVCLKLPYGEWLKQGQIEFADVPLEVDVTHVSGREQDQLIKLFGYTREDLDILIKPMAFTGEEAIGSMGNDTPAALLSRRPQNLFTYFRQLFAQVTNPAIDPIREAVVMSLSDSIGKDGSVLDPTPANARQIRIHSPVLTLEECAKLRQLPEAGLDVRAATISTVFDTEESYGALERALSTLCRKASQAVEDGYSALILSDRMVSDRLAAIPSLLAVSTIHHHLTREGVRAQVALIVESGEPREVHHFACLMGYGASAVCPYVALEISAGFEPEKGVANFVRAVNKGLLKVMSKMGISTLRSYRGSQLFEALGLSSKVIEEYFTGTPTRLEGLLVEDIEREYRMIHASAYDLLEEGLDGGGRYQWRRGGEHHALDPVSIPRLQDAVRKNSFATFEEFTNYVETSEDQASEIRGLLDIIPVKPSVDLEHVESAKEIVKRFTTGAMSLGAISKESHEALAIAMNQIGGRSNSGEGGEDPERFADNRRSKIKQVASGRFGVTTHYLVNADELQIKIAQGAKPGEGGQLPGHKVDAYIGRIRNTIPGVTLISPPPHHDIYSIEDLAQLIHDLRSVNTKARISVKLVAEAGVGTVAAGVVKADADSILISGAEGGTGAAPLTSIKHAGIPWELGLAETQQVLVRNGLRGRVRLQVDGQLKTGREVVVAALLGADEFGFSTAPLVAQGCIMMRVCHLGTCPVGIATQDPELRKRFEGKPEHVVNYFFFVAEQVRRLMARLGYRRFDEMIGQVECLRAATRSRHWKARGLDFSQLLAKMEPWPGDSLRALDARKTFAAGTLESGFLNEVKRALNAGRPIELASRITNADRSFGGNNVVDSPKQAGPLILASDGNNPRKKE